MLITRVWQINIIPVNIPPRIFVSRLISATVYFFLRIKNTRCISEIKSELSRNGIFPISDKRERPRAALKLPRLPQIRRENNVNLDRSLNHCLWSTRIDTVQVFQRYTHLVGDRSPSGRAGLCCK